MRSFFLHDSRTADHNLQGNHSRGKMSKDRSNRLCLLPSIFLVVLEFRREKNHKVPRAMFFLQIMAAILELIDFSKIDHMLNGFRDIA